MTYMEAIDLIFKYKDRLIEFCPFDSDIYIIYGSMSGTEEFPNMEYSNYAEIEENQIIIYSGERGLNGFLKELDRGK